MTKLNMDRREFLKVGSTGTAALVLGFCWPMGCKEGTLPGETFIPNAYVTIHPDGIIEVTMPRSEMGQKIYTALPQIVAEELDADWAMIRVVQGDLDRETFGSQSTGGSASIRTQYDRLRKAGATARAMLVEAAALTWEVPVTECYADESMVIHGPSGRELHYGDLTTLAATLPVPAEVALKDPKKFKIIGKAYKSLDGRGKVDGSIKFGYDFELEGQLTAVIKRIPKFGGSVESFDAEAALKVPGVIKVFQVSAGVAIVAENTYAALEGRKQLDVTWNDGPNAKLSSEDISRQLHAAMESPDKVIREEGVIQPGKAHQLVDLTFEVPFLDHAPQEPNNCTAWIHDDICEVWAPSQNPENGFWAAKHACGYDDDRIVIHTLRMGGAFGRKLQGDFVLDAVEVALQVDGPVKVVRMRTEDLRNGFYRPASVHHAKLGLGKKGDPLFWTHHLSGPEAGWAGMITGGADELAYTLPAQKVSYSMTPIPIPIGAWRSVAHTQNAFVHESMFDEAARLSGQDPVALRRELLQHSPRHLGVLDLAAEKAGWTEKLPQGRARGFAVHFSFHSYLALVVEVGHAEGGGIKLHKITAAIDCGTVINPDGVRSQVEGGIVMGLTAALHGEISIRKGAVRESNFHNYRLLTMSEMPEIDVHIVPSEEAPTGAGEPPVPPTPPALTNAIAALTGKRITRLPIKDQLG